MNGEGIKGATGWWRIRRNGWREKWNQSSLASYMSSSWEQCQISSWRIKSPMIIGPQHRLHLGMSYISRGEKNQWTLITYTNALFFGLIPKLYSVMCICSDLSTKTKSNWRFKFWNWDLKIVERDAQRAKLIFTLLPTLHCWKSCWIK